MKPYRLRTLIPLVFLISGSLWSCASGGGGGSEGEERRNPNLITEAELQALPSGTAYSAIERLRPIWLRSRGGSSPRVFLDDRDFGPLTSLRDLSLDSVSEIRFISARDATTRYGIGYAGGVISVMMKRPG